MPGNTNFRLGSAGKAFFKGNVTLSSGTGTLTTNLTAIDTDGVQITQKDATAVADGVSWSASGGVITVDSSNGSSTETYTVWAIGY